MIKSGSFAVAFSLALTLFWRRAICDGELTTIPTDDGDIQFNIQNDLYVLNKNNFDEFVKSKDTSLVEFYAPWCGHCKNLAPHYEKAAKSLRWQDPPVYLAKVDSTVETELSERFEVKGYPTMFIFKRGVQIDYDGPRDVDGIVSHMKAYSDPFYQFPKNETITLTRDNFTEVVTKEEFMVVMFYAPWCAHCKKMLPEYEKAAKELVKQGYSVPFAIVNAIEEEELAKLYNVSNYPTLKFFRKGRDYLFKSDARDKWSIVEYVGKHIGEGSSAIADLQDLSNKIASKEDSCVFLAFFNSSDDKAYKVYLELVNERRDDYSFYHSFEPSHRAAFKVNHSTFFIFYTEIFQSKHEPKYRLLNLSGDSTPSDIDNFIEKHQIPLVGEYKDQTKDKQYKNKRPLIIFFYTVDWSFEHRDATQLWRRKFTDIAINHPELTFVVADDDANKEIFNEFGFDDSGEEVNVGIISKDGRKFPMKPMEEFYAKEVLDFITKFNQGLLKPRVKSQQIPRKQTGPVVVVVGKSFEKIVLDPHKDVLIELYAPGCGHCKQLEPTYKELAKRLKSEKDVIVAKMDATANDSPANYLASGYPTIYFAPSNRKDNPVLFEGNHTLEELMAFVKTHGMAFQKDKKEEL